PARPAHGRTREVAPGFAAMGRLRRSALAREADRRRAVDLVRIRGHERSPDPGARMRPVFIVSAALAAEAENGAPEDANRLRRMDRFGRTGFLAGTRAFRAWGAPRPPEPDARGGVVVGTRHGCRPAITEHAARLAAAARVEDLAPSVFAAPVHHSVNGELVVAAEGVDDAMREAWGEERSAIGSSAAGVELVETGASVLLEALKISSNREEKKQERIRFVDGCLFFEPDAQRASARFFEWMDGVE